MNQWVDSYLLQHFAAVSTIPTQFLQVPSDIAKSDPELSHLFSTQNDREQPLCLGSLYPVHPEQRAVFDFLPRNLWHKIVNLADFATTFILDQLLGMNRSRCILYVRDRPCYPSLFRAYFVDTENILGGSDSKIKHSVDFKSYCSWHAYRSVSPAHWLGAMEFVGSKLLPDCQAALAGVPAAWLDTGDLDEMKRLFEQLQQRQQTLPKWVQIPSPCLHFPAQQAVLSVSRPAASAKLSPTLSPA